MSRGVIYLGIGESHCEEAIISAHSLKQVMPDLPVVLTTDRQVKDSCFDEVNLIDVKSYDRSFNIKLMRDSPFEQTLSLDTDTYVCGDLSEAFELLQRFDMAATLSQNATPIFRKEGAPSSFPQLNGGVLFYRDSDTMKKFFTRWLTYYEQDCGLGPKKLYPSAGAKREFVHNQPSLRQAVYESDIRLATLPLEYNCRIGWNGFLNDSVRILHGHMPDPVLFERQVNEYTDKRLYFKRGKNLIVKPGKIQRRIQRVLNRYL